MQTLKLNEDERKMAKLRAMADGITTFRALVDRLKSDGEARNDGDAITKAANLRPDLYNEFKASGN